MAQHYWYIHNPLNKTFENVKDRRNLTKVIRENCENSDPKKAMNPKFSKAEKKGRSYKCSREGCTMNFETAGLRAEHEKLHQILVLCPHSECKSLIPGLELNDHIEIVHHNFKDRCYYCKKTFDWLKLTTHVRSCKEKYV